MQIDGPHQFEIICSDTQNQQNHKLLHHPPIFQQKSKHQVQLHYIQQNQIHQTLMQHLLMVYHHRHFIHLCQIHMEGLKHLLIF